MQIQYIPLLKLQREIQGVPRGPDRFREYLRTIKSDDGLDIDLVPLLAANPMAREHVTALLDTLLALDADAVGASAAVEACSSFPDLPGEFKAALVVADDVMGGGTNRFAYELDLRSPSPGDKRFWITGVHEADYTREILRRHLDATDIRTKIECLFGDVAARSLGFPPRGLSLGPDWLSRWLMFGGPCS